MVNFAFCTLLECCYPWVLLPPVNEVMYAAAPGLHVHNHSRCATHAVAHLALVLQAKDLVYVTAPGPPSRVYGLRVKSGSRQWEFKSPVASALLADLAGPAYSSSKGHARTVFLAYSAPGPAGGPGGVNNSSSWLQALDIDRGSAMWRSEPLQQVQLQQLELHRATLVAMPAAADALYGFDYSNGALMWMQQRPFCSTPSPIAESYGGQVVLASSCSGPLDLAVMGAETGTVFWDGWEMPSDAVPTGNCTWVSVKDNSIMFGCSCSIHGKGKHSSRSYSSSRGASSSNMPEAAAVPGICMYSVSMRSGKLHWVLPLQSEARFPANAQQWGMRPLQHEGLAVFLAEDRLIAVDSYWGNLTWTLKLELGDTLQPWQQPALRWYTSADRTAAKQQQNGSCSSSAKPGEAHVATNSQRQCTAARGACRGPRAAVACRTCVCRGLQGQHVLLARVQCEQRQAQVGRVLGC
jgi:hypothetical protein